MPTVLLAGGVKLNPEQQKYMKDFIGRNEHIADKMTDGGRAFMANHEMLRYLISNMDDSGFTDMDRIGIAAGACNIEDQLFRLLNVTEEDMKSIQRLDKEREAMLHGLSLLDDDSQLNPPSVAPR